MIPDANAQSDAGSGMTALPRVQTIAYVTGNIGMNLMYQLIAVFLLYFYTDVFGITAAAAGVVLLIARIIDIVADPTIGLAIDRTRSRWGKFRPYLLFGPIPLGLLAVLCFSSPALGDGMKVLYAAATYSAFSVVYALVNVSYAAMLPTLTQDYFQRSAISSYRELVGTLAILVVNAGTLVFVHMFGSEAIGFPVVVAVYGIATAITLFVVFAGTKRTHAEIPQHEETPERVSLIDQFRPLLGNRPLFRILAFNFAFNLASGIHLAAIVYFFKYILDEESAFFAYQSITTAAMFVAMMTVPWLVRRAGKRISTLLAQAITIVGLVGLYFGYHNMLLVFIFGCLVNAGFGMARSNVWGMIPDTVEYGQWLSGHRSEGITYAAFIGVEKLGTAFGGIVSGLTLAVAGFIANTDLDSTAVFGILSLTTLLPAIGSAAVIVAVWGYRLDSSGFARILAELRKSPAPTSRSR